MSQTMFPLTRYPEPSLLPNTWLPAPSVALKLYKQELEEVQELLGLSFPHLLQDVCLFIAFLQPSAYLLHLL